MNRKIVYIPVSLLSMIVFWEIGSFIAPSILPRPLEVARLSYSLSTSSNIDGYTALYHLRVSLIRIGIITLIALSVSIIIGIAMGSIRVIENPVSNFIPFWMAFPPLIIILLAMALIGFSELTVIIAVFIATTPYGVVNVWKGTKNVDGDLIEMAEVYDLKRSTIWRQIYIPSVQPYLFSTGRYLFSMIWKITMLAEMFGVEAGIGARIRFWFSQADIPHLLAYFLLFFITLVVIEYGIISRLEDYAFQWRDESSSIL